MGWWSGNRKDVNRRARARFAEAKGLVAETEDLAGESRALKEQYLTKGHRRMMTSNLKGLVDSREAIRKQEEGAMSRVAEVTGDNPLAALRARQDLVSDAELQDLYGAYADERVDIYGRKKAGQLDIETSYLQNMSQAKSEMASIIMQFHEEADPGMGGSIMGMAGAIIGGAIGGGGAAAGTA